MAYSIGSISFDGTINIFESENYVLDGNLTPLPLYGSNSSETDVFDYGGATLIITLTAVHVGTPAEHGTFVQGTLLPIISGAQTGTTQYVSTILGSPKVKIMSITGDSVEGDVRKHRWTIKMIQSSTAG